MYRFAPSPLCMCGAGSSAHFAQTKKGMPTTPPVGDEHTNVASGVAQATPRRGCLLASQGEQRYFLPVLYESMIEAYKTGRLLSYVWMRDGVAMLVVDASLGNAVALLCQHVFQRFSPSILSATLIPLIEDFAEFTGVCCEQRSIQKILWHSQRSWIIGGQIETGQVAVYSTSHLNLCLPVAAVDDYIIDMGFDLQTGFAAGVYDKQMIFCRDFKVVQEMFPHIQLFF